ncbi:MAG: nicotinate-nucleotide adenylyltransferase [Candidatus Oxydemutatoraceae bacterium WSBS_2016_MAG_OTU14]
MKISAPVQNPPFAPLLIFGGAFDPVHFGHIRAMMHLTKNIEQCEVRLLPCHNHPSKEVIASDQDRIAMLRLLENPPQLTIDERELQCAEVCYTVDTLTEIRQEIGHSRSLAFVLGQDAFKGIDTWKDYLSILDTAHLIVLMRPGWNDLNFDEHPLVRRCHGWSPLDELHQQTAGKLFCLDNQLVDISSRQIRAAISQREDPRYLLPATIWQYIQHKKLYHTHT